LEHPFIVFNDFLHIEICIIYNVILLIIELTSLAFFDFLHDFVRLKIFIVSDRRSNKFSLLHHSLLKISLASTLIVFLEPSIYIIFLTSIVLIKLASIFIEPIAIIFHNSLRNHTRRIVLFIIVYLFIFAS